MAENIINADLKGMSEWQWLADGRCTIELLHWEDIYWVACKVQIYNEWSIFYEPYRNIQYESSKFEAVIGFGSIIKDEKIIKSLVNCSPEFYRLYSFTKRTPVSDINISNYESLAKANQRWNDWQEEQFNKNPWNQ